MAQQKCKVASVNPEWLRLETLLSRSAQDLGMLQVAGKQRVPNQRTKESMCQISRCCCRCSPTGPHGLPGSQRRLPRCLYKFDFPAFACLRWGTWSAKDEGFCFELGAIWLLHELCTSERTEVDTWVTHLHIYIYMSI